MLLGGSRNRADAAQTKTGHPGIRFPRNKSSHWLRDPASGRYERENMLQNSILSKSAKSLLQRLIGIRLTRLSTLAAGAFGMAVSLSPATVRAQEYPWCLSREGYLYCFYKTQEQCQWTASGIGGCALNPRLLFANKPRDSNQNLLSHMK
jgi:Protein of unknown function (DUF3551)